MYEILSKTTIRQSSTPATPGLPKNFALFLGVDVRPCYGRTFPGGARLRTGESIYQKERTKNIKSKRWSIDFGLKTAGKKVATGGQQTAPGIGAIVSSWVDASNDALQTWFHSELAEGSTGFVTRLELLNRMFCSKGTPICRRLYKFDSCALSAMFDRLLNFCERQTTRCWACWAEMWWVEAKLLKIHAKRMRFFQFFYSDHS